MDQSFYFPARRIDRARRPGAGQPRYRALLEALEPRTLLAVELVKDINATRTFVAPPNNLIDVNGTLMFIANHRLWKSDGTPAGTAQFYNGWGSRELSNIGGQPWFVSIEGALWKSDGTQDGSVQVSNGTPNPRDIFDVNGRAFFRGSDGGGDELWSSDGTPTGTYRVKDIRPGGAGSNPRGFVNVNGRLFFRADDGINGLELWTSDGTEAGTFMVKDIAPGSASSGPTSLVNVSGTLYFAASDGASGFELWKSDGSEAGTMRVIDLRPGVGGSSPVSLTNVGGTLMFLANDGVHGFEIWKSDGTAGGTTIVRDLVPGAGGALIDNLAAVGSTLFFTADDGSSGMELWKTDGTSGGTARVKDIGAGSSSSHPGLLTALGDGQRLFFVASTSGSGTEPWISDGTEAGTFMLKDIAGGSNRSQVGEVTVSGIGGGRVFFVADDFGGPALWATDGTIAGTEKLKQPTDERDLGASVANGINVGGVAYFSATDGINGPELWRSDGTAAGTYMVKELAAGSWWSNFEHFTDLNGTLLFQINSRWYRSDGTPAGTFQISDVAVRSQIKPVVVGNAVYFAGSGTGGNGLWKTDGTAGGTAFVKSFGSFQYWWPQSLTNVNGTLMFAADNTTNGHELWKSDGTPTGTVMVKDILPGPASSGLELLTAAGPRLFFRANGGSGAGYELWTSDGTEAGTVMVKDIRAGGESSMIWEMAGVGSTLFFSADDGTSGHELWTSDGTAAGTALLKDINPGGRGSSIGSMLPAHGLLWFRASHASSGDELWTSDGTAAGTVMVKDATGGTGESGFGLLSALPNGRVLMADGAYRGWISDGTSDGTFMFYPSYAESPVVLGNELLFGTWDRDLLKLDLGTVAPAAQSAPAAAVATSEPMLPSIATSSDPFGPDEFYNAVINKYDASSFAFPTINVAYHSAAFVSRFDDRIPDEEKLRRLAEQAANSGKPLALNVEHWGVDARYYPEGTVQLGLEKFGEIFDWMHDQRPDVRVGQAGLFPNGQWPAPVPGGAAEAAWKNANDRLASTVAKMDIMFGGVYQLDASVKSFVDFARAQQAEASRYGKPRLPLIWPVYDGSFDGAVWRRPLSAEFWRLQLDVMHELADGAVVWGEWARFDEDLPWYTVMRDFTMHPDPLPPPAPSSLTATPNTSTARINLIWKDNAWTESGYRIERRADGEADFTTIATLGADATSYADTTAASQVGYTYRVVAFSAGGDSLAIEVSGKLLVAPNAPTDVSATALSSRRVRVTWTPPPASHEVQSFEIERSGLVVATVAGDVSAFEDSALEPGTHYPYRVRAINAAGESPWSAAASVTTPVGDGSLRGHWRFDEVAGGAASDSGPANLNGSLVNGPTWTSGNLGGALAFDGGDDRVTVPDAATLRFNASDNFTLSTWVHLASLPGKWTGVVTKARGSALGNWYGIWLDHANRWVVGGNTNLTGATATTGWSHVAVVQDGSAGTRRLYVNGIEVASGAAQVADGAGDLWIGGAEGVNEFFAGKIDDVRIYARAIGAADVAAFASPRVTLSGSNAADAFVIRLDDAGERYEFFVNTPTTAAATFTRLRDAVASIDIAAGDGADRVEIDFARGNALPDYGFTFNGGAGSGDAVVLRGASIGDAFSLDATTIQHGGVAIGYVNTEAIEVFNGTFTLTGDVNGRSLFVGAGSSAVLNATQRLSMLQVDPAGTLDVRDETVVLDYSSVSPIGVWVGSSYDGLAGLIASGRIVSTLATTNPRTMVALAEARDALNLSAGQSATWSGRSVDSTTVLVKFTWGGDANVDGKINIDDYGRIDGNVNQSGSIWGWFNGDFNYDGKINIDDYGIIDGNINQQNAIL